MMFALIADRLKRSTGLSAVCVCLTSILSEPSLYAKEEKPASQQEEAPVKNEVKPAEALVSYRMEANTLFCDGREVKGVITLNAPPVLYIKHIKGGIGYERKVQLSSFARLEIHKWRPKPIRQSDRGWIYEFEPSQFQLKLKDGTNLLLDENYFNFISSFPLDNANGQVRLFTIWRDLQRKDGSWYTGLSGPTASPWTTCFKDVVKEIRWVDFER